MLVNDDKMPVFSLFVALILLLPAFPAIPSFIIGIFIGRHFFFSERKGISPWIAVLLGILAIAAATLISLPLLNISEGIKFLGIVLILFFLSGAPVGIFFVKMKSANWLVVLPVTMVGFLAWLIYAFFTGLD